MSRYLKVGDPDILLKLDGTPISQEELCNVYWNPREWLVAQLRENPYKAVVAYTEKALDLIKKEADHGNKYVFYMLASDKCSLTGD